MNQNMVYLVFNENTRTILIHNAKKYMIREHLINFNVDFSIEIFENFSKNRIFLELIQILYIKLYMKVQ